MFDAHCRSCGQRVLLSSRRILSLHHTSEGIVVYFRCWCGHPGMLLTGRGVRADEEGRAVECTGEVEPAPAAAPTGEVEPSPVAG